MLCGAGVVFKLVQALIQKAVGSGQGLFSDLRKQSPDHSKSPWPLLPVGWEKWLLDLVAIATVADMVPLVGENRTLVHFGLRVLRRSRRPGIQQLCRELRLAQEFLTEDDIGFLIGPRLNSASRMAHAWEAFELLTTTDIARAGALAKKLEQNNQARKVAVQKILDETAGRLTEPLPLLVLGHEDWSLGVLGLAASRLVELYRRPVFVWGKNGSGLIKGSCRSDGSVHLVDLMRAADDGFFTNIGGHAQAGGFSLPLARLSELGPRLQVAFEQINKTVVAGELVLESELELLAITPEFYHQLEQLGPFGLGNPKPIFLLTNVAIASARVFGGAKDHLELELAAPTGGGQPLKAVSFFNLFPEHNLQSGQTLDLAVTLEKSYFRGSPRAPRSLGEVGELRLRIVDLRPAA